MGKEQVEEVVWRCDAPDCDELIRVPGHGGQVPQEWASVTIERGGVDVRRDGAARRRAEESPVLSAMYAIAEESGQVVQQVIVCPTHRRHTLDRIAPLPEPVKAQP